jgi:hypothetical protein
MASRQDARTADEHLSHRLSACREGPLAVYRWFTEGFGAPVLKEAKALLEQPAN